jgi:very-short-patch-repair endonuclease
MRKDDPYYHEGMWKGAPSNNFGRAKSLRAQMTEAEKHLWEELKKESLTKYRFRRQHPIQNFIVDFYSHNLKLIIEVDGEYHNTPQQIKQDQEKTDVLEFNGLNVLRFTNKEVLNDTTRVLEEINRRIKSIPFPRP